MQSKQEYQIIIKLILSDEEFELLSMAIKMLKDPRQALGPSKFWTQNIFRRSKDKNDESAVTVTIAQIESILLKSLEPFILYKPEQNNYRKPARILYSQLEDTVVEAVKDYQNLNYV